MAENTIIHEISLAGYKATSTGGMLDLGTWGSYGIEKLHLTLDAAWQDLTITAFFNVNGKVVAKRVVGKDGYADVPWEATKENTFSGCLAFEGSINGQRRISTNLNYKVTNHSETTDSDPVPTDDRWNQFVTETKGYRDGAFEAAERANTRSEDAETASEDAQAAARAAKASENAAAASASNAAADAAKAGPYAEAARAAQEAAESARDKAIAAQQAAENAAAAAADSKSAADTLAAEAARAALAAENSKAAANNAANLAGENATAAQQAAATATAAANDAGQSASDAAASKAAAETAAKAAQDAQTATAAAKAEAVKAQEAAQTAAKSAQDAQAASENVRDDAQTAQQGAEAARDAAAKSAEAAAKSEANVKQSADTLAESVKNITPDDSSIGDKPWSSKHIIDMLCPPLEESGNPVVCYPVAGYPLGVKASWEPVQEGTGTPYPAGGGKNLFNPAWMPEKAMSYGVTWTITPDGTVAANGTASGTTYYNSDNFLLPAGTYTISAMSHFRVTIRNKDTNDTITAQNVGQPCTFTVENDIQNANLFFAASGTLDNVSAKPQIEKGATATAYAPYANIRPIKGRDSVTITRQEDNQVITLNMPETVYSGEVDAVTGDGKETRKTLTLDGTTNKFTQRDRYWNLPQNSAPGIADSYDTTCSHFPANTFGGNLRGKYLYTTAKLMSKYFPDANALNAYLVAQYAAGSPVQVYYNLTEPVPFTATGAQPLPALAGVNTVLTDADSATVTGRADPIKRITDLEDAVASQT